MALTAALGCEDHETTAGTATGGGTSAGTPSGSGGTTTSSTTTTTTTLPEWVPAPGQYVTASTEVARLQCPFPDESITQNSIFSVWNGGAYAPTLGTHGALLFFGGGHFSNAIPFVVAFDLGTRVWSILNPDAPVVTLTTDGDNLDKVNEDGVFIGYEGTEVAGNYVDCQPAPPHTNMACDFCPPEAWPADCPGGGLGGFVFMHHDNTGVLVTNTYLFLFSLELCQWIKTKVNLGVHGDFLKGTVLASMSYDPARRGFWVTWAGHTRLCFVDLVAQSSQLADINGGSVEVGGYANHTLVPDRDLLVFAVRTQFPDGWSSSQYPNDMPPNPCTIYCIRLSGFAKGVTTSLPGQPIIHTGPPNPFLWTGQQWESDGAGGWRPAWNNYLCCEKLEHCAYDGGLWSIDGYAACATPSACTLYRLLPPAGDPFEEPWTWTSETLAPAPTSLHDFVWMMQRGEAQISGADARLYGKFRYVPALQAFAMAENHPGDYDDVHCQVMRPAAFA